MIQYNPEVTYLMKRAKTGKYAAPYPTGEPPLRRVARRRDPDTRRRVERHELVVQAVVEAVEKRCAARNHNVGEQMGSDVRVDLAEGGLDKGGDCLALLRSGVFGVLDSILA